MNDVVGYLGLTLLAAAFPFALPLTLRAPLGVRMGLLLLSCGILWAPWFSGKPPLFYVRGVLGDVSLPTQVLLVLGLCRVFGWQSAWTRTLPRDLALLVAGTLACLYACTLGYGPRDLYAWGYQPQVMLPVTALLLGYAWARHPGLAVAWLIGLAGHAFRLGLSVNLWDALGDPLLCLGGMWRIVFRGWAANLEPATEANGRSVESGAWRAFRRAGRSGEQSCTT
jgi:hypothetical protein